MSMNAKSVGEVHMGQSKWNEDAYNKASNISNMKGQYLRSVK